MAYINSDIFNCHSDPSLISSNDGVVEGGTGELHKKERKI